MCVCLCVLNSYNDEERCVVAGYDSGDVKIFDLKMNKVRWEGNVGNGVCGVEFDRKEIEMNKFVVACLESKFHVFDARTQHSTKGFASAVQDYKTTPSFIAMQVTHSFSSLPHPLSPSLPPHSLPLSLSFALRR